MPGGTVITLKSMQVPSFVLFKFLCQFNKDIGFFFYCGWHCSKALAFMHDLKRLTKLNWGSVSNFQGFVKSVLSENIEHLGLED